MRSDITVSTDNLPEADGRIEQDYIDLIKALYDDKQRYMAESDKEKTK